MKKLILMFLLFPSLLFAQNSTNHTDLVTVTIKIVDYMYDCDYIDAPFYVEDSLDKKYDYQDVIIQKMGSGQHKIALKKGQKYVVTVPDYEIDEETSYIEAREKINLLEPTCLIHISSLFTK